jgi:deoxycytidine triphosphate deaminase
MSVVALTTQGDNPSVVTTDGHFLRSGGRAVLIKGLDTAQLPPPKGDCNLSYDLRVGRRFRDHRDKEPRTLQEGAFLKIPPQTALIVRTEEEVQFPPSLFGIILPKVSLLQRGIANTPTKIDPGYKGYLLVTTFNHGKKTVTLQRGEQFCAMFVMTTEGDVVPYDKQGKDFEVEAGRSLWKAMRGFLDRNNTIIQTVHMIITIVLMITTIFLAILYKEAL